MSNVIDREAAQASPQAGGTRAFKILAVALTASVSLNLLLGGLIAGAALRPEPQPRSEVMTLRHAMRSGAIETREAARAALSQRRPAYQELRGELEAARRAAAQAARAEPFDAERLAAALGEMRGAQAQIAALGHEALAQVLGSVPPEQREAIAHGFSHVEGHGAHGRRGGDGGKPR